MVLTFTSDSPIFHQQVQQISTEYKILSEYLKQIVKLMNNFCKDIKQCAKSAESVGIQIQRGFPFPRNEENNEIFQVLNFLGDTFCEMASAQEILAESLESSVSNHLESFASSDIPTFLEKCDNYNAYRDVYDSSLLKYLQSDVSNFGRGCTQQQMESRACEVIESRRRLELTRIDLVKLSNEINSKKLVDFSQSCVSGAFSLRTYHHRCMDHLARSEQFYNEIQTRQQLENQQISEHLLPFERIKSDMTAVLEAMTERVNIVLPELTSENSNRTNSVDNPNGNSLGLSMDASENEVDYHPSEESPPPSDRLSSSASSSTGTSYVSSITKMGVSIWGTGATFVQSLARGNSSKSSSMDSSERRENTRRIHLSSPLSHANAYSCEDCESKMKALDTTELHHLFARNTKEDENMCIIRQGYLWKRSDKQYMIENWKRRWFILDDHKLYYLTESSETGAISYQIVCDTLLCSVREVKDMNLPFCFEISYASVGSTIVQAEGFKEYYGWIGDIKQAVEKRLIDGPSIKTLGIRDTKNLGISEDKIMNSSTLKADNQILIDEICQLNNTCAECEKVAPDWICLNFACVVCIDCSGVHRAMGVHFSKVRSLTLDRLEKGEYELLLTIGNKIHNEMWEACLLPDYPKPQPGASYAERDRYIRLKYEARKFVVLKDEVDEGVLVGKFRVACQENNVKEVLRILMTGGKQFLLPSSKRSSISSPVEFYPLHEACKFNALQVVVLLCVNGADILCPDGEGLTPLDVARASQSEDVAAYLQVKIDASQIKSILSLSATPPLPPSTSNLPTSASGKTTPESHHHSLGHGHNKQGAKKIRRRKNDTY